MSVHVFKELSELLSKSMSDSQVGNTTAVTPATGLEDEPAAFADEPATSSDEPAASSDEPAAASAGAVDALADAVSHKTTQVVTAAVTEKLSTLSGTIQRQNDGYAMAVINDNRMLCVWERLQRTREGLNIAGSVASCLSMMLPSNMWAAIAPGVLGILSSFRLSCFGAQMFLTSEVKRLRAVRALSRDETARACSETVTTLLSTAELAAYPLLLFSPSPILTRLSIGWLASAGALLLAAPRLFRAECRQNEVNLAVANPPRWYHGVLDELWTFGIVAVLLVAKTAGLTAFIRPSRLWDTVAPLS